MAWPQLGCAPGSWRSPATPPLQHANGELPAEGRAASDNLAMGAVATQRYVGVPPTALSLPRRPEHAACSLWLSLREAVRREYPALLNDFCTDSEMELVILLLRGSVANCRRFSGVGKKRGLLER